MTLSLNPINAIKIYTENKRYRKEAAAEYLESVAEEASKLAEIWQEIIKEISHSGIYDVPDYLINNLLMSRIPMCNSCQYWRLEEHYKQVSSVLGRNYNDELNSIIFHIGSVIEKRNLTKEFVIKELSAIKQAKLFHKENDPSNFNSLHESVDGLHKEAAALHVRAKAFKATL